MAGNSVVGASGFSAEQRELLRLLVGREGIELETPRAMPRREGRERAPLSFAQQRLWFLGQFEPDNPAYNISTALRLRGRLDVGILQRTLAEVVRRHEALRTVFDMEDGEPVQVILPASSFRLPVVDLALLGPAAAAAATAFAGEEALRPFDLQRGPLLRVTVLRLDEAGHVVLLTLHHIVSDGWSSGVLIKELVEIYKAFSAGRRSPLAELPIQYADFAVWQRQHLAGAVLDRELAYWRGKLSALPTLALPTDHPRPLEKAHRGAVCHFVLPPQLTTALRALISGGDVSLFMLLLAGFSALLSRYSGQEDLAVGTPIANRTLVETEGLIGFFVNTLVLRADLSGRPRFVELLARVREMTLEAYNHQDLPFEKLVEELRPERDLAHTPLFQVVFALQNVPLRSFDLPGLQLLSFPVPRRTAKFDLTLVMNDSGPVLEGSLEFDTALFAPATAERLAAHFQVLLTVAVEAPGVPVDELDLLSPQERVQVLVEWSGGKGDYPRGECLHELFALRAAEDPEATALVFEGGGLSYGELNVWANRLAGCLRSRGVGPETAVALLQERSPELVASILGVLKAGGTYVPIDPEAPEERIRFVLSDAGARTVVTREGLRGRVPEGVGVVCMDGEDLAGFPAAEVAGGAVAQSLAYVIYTSGSTGHPKGVGVPHANAVRLLSATQAGFGFGRLDVWTLFPSYAFDFSVWELWGALALGGRLVVVPYWVSRSPEAFYELLCAEGVTVLNQTPSAFRQLQQAEETKGVDPRLALREVVFGGEALEFESLRPWFDRHGDRRPRLVNMYGITETTVHVTYRPVSSSDLTGRSRSLLGCAIPDLRLYVVDRRLQPVPVGVPGELVVGGAGLARGYVKRAELTAERFVPDPFGRVGGERLYRSGDLVRRLADGDLEYLGRIDQQVKVRGFRIEPGEIEAALLGHPGVRAAVVVVREDVAGGPRLVAYVVEQGQAPEPGELRELLRSRLPEYMVPAHFVPLAALPLTAHGKLDRQALPAPDTGRSDLAEAYAPPRTPEEEILAAIWEKTLGLSSVGIHDNFFALGGDSILSIQVVALARRKGVETSLPQLFRHQTIAALAAEVASRTGVSLAVAPPPPFGLISEEERRLLPPDIEDAYPVARLQAGMLFHMALRPDDPPYHNIDSWHLKGPFEAVPFKEAVDRVALRHPVMRTSFHLTGYSEPLQLVHRRVDLPVTVGDLRSRPQAEQELEIAAYMAGEKRRLFDFTEAPQLRFQIHLRSAETFQLTLTENHAIFDGWSLHSTLAEIFALYEELRTGRDPAPQPPPPVAYRDFIALEHAALASEECERFWLATLRDLPRLQLPDWGDAPRPANGRRIRMRDVIPLETLTRLEKLARTAAVPVKSVFLAGHLRVLSLLSGQEEIVTGYVVNGRPEEAGGDQVRGLFLNALPFRLALVARSWAELVQAVFDREREMLPFRRYPMAEMRTRMGGQPLFESLFTYIHFHVVAEVLQSGGVEVLGAQMSEGTEFPLQVTFNRSPLTSYTGLSVEYDSSRIAADQAEAIYRYYHRVFELMAADPAADPSELDLLSPQERVQVLVEWSGGKGDYPRGECLHELFALRAAEDPEATALVFEGGGLSYGELNVWANRLAGCLRSRGVGPETAVALLQERSPELVASILGVLKAGGTYVPIDPEAPEERIRFVLSDAGARTVVTREGLRGRVPEGVGVVCMDGEDLAGFPAAEVAGGAVAQSLAYVIYTSGSTGHPKGVGVPHANVVRLLSATQEWFGFGRQDVWTLFHSYAFDFSVWELWGALALGGRLVVVPYWVSRSPEAVYELLCAEGVTVLNQTPSAFRQLQQAEETKGVDPRLALREVVFGGEALEFESLRPWFDRHGDRRPRLVNMYGITETTVHVTYRPVSSSDLTGRSRSLLGCAIPDLRLYVVDRRLQPVPVGVPGELVVGGAGLARGYVKRAELTAERFVPDPFGRVGGERLYRSGDLVRRLADGDLEYLGRIDQQVKVRGFRIEPGEIEAALLGHPGVRAAVVVVREDVAGGPRLVAYVVEQGQAPEPGELRELLRSRLPEYMVPAHFVPLAALPLTAHGKLDRQALPAPDTGRSDLAEAYAPPRTPEEEILAAIWGSVLGLDRIGRLDNFFDLGGHSLLVTQVVSRIREAFQIELPLRELFEHPTLESFAALVEDACRDQPGQRIEKIGRGEEGAIELPVNVEGLSEEDLDALLQMLGDEGGYP